MLLLPVEEVELFVIVIHTQLSRFVVVNVEGLDDDWWFLMVKANSSRCQVEHADR